MTMTHRADYVTAQSVTIYSRSRMLGGYRKTEARSVKAWIAPYAQHARAVHCEHVPKGARLTRHDVESFRPSILILAGHGHPDPADVFGDKRSADGATVSKSRFRSQDPAWSTEFDAMIDAYLAAHPEVKVVADFRRADVGGERDRSAERAMPCALPVAAQ